jgi:hypothetical protein
MQEQVFLPDIVLSEAEEYLFLHQPDNEVKKLLKFSEGERKCFWKCANIINKKKPDNMKYIPYDVVAEYTFKYERSSFDEKHLNIQVYRNYEDLCKGEISIACCSFVPSFSTTAHINLGSTNGIIINCLSCEFDLIVLNE